MPREDRFSCSVTCNESLLFAKAVTITAMRTSDPVQKNKLVHLWGFFLHLRFPDSFLNPAW